MSTTKPFATAFVTNISFLLLCIIFTCTSGYSPNHCNAFTVGSVVSLTRRNFNEKTRNRIIITLLSPTRNKIRFASGDEGNKLMMTRDNASNNDSNTGDTSHPPNQNMDLRMKRVVTTALVATLLLAGTTMTTSSSNSWAVSGGGLDYAGTDISGQDFSSSNYKGKDFTQVIAKGTKFRDSNLQGCRFYKAYLVKADFTNANIRGASLEDTSMDDADMTGTVAIGAYFSSSLKDVKTLTNSDFTDAQIPTKTLQQICNREDVTGTNPQTGTDTRESFMCL